MDTKKYIIEIPDNTAWLQWVKVSDKDGHVYFDFKDPEDLTPYTDMVSKDEVDKIHDEARDRGYKEGQARGYQEGLFDAWEATRNIVNMIGVKRKDIFGYMTYLSIMNKFSATEVIEKIKQYEQKQEEQIQVGDEVMFYNGEKCIVTVVVDGQAAEVMDKGGFSMRMDDGLRNSMKKTGRHFLEIAEVLRKMREKES